MNIRIEKSFLLNNRFSLLFLSAVFAYDLPEINEGFDISQYDVQVYYDSNPDSHEMDILNLPREAWLPLPGDFVHPQGS